MLKYLDIGKKFGVCEIVRVDTCKSAQWFIYMWVICLEINLGKDLWVLKKISFPARDAFPSVKSVDDFNFILLDINSFPMAFLRCSWPW